MIKFYNQLDFIKSDIKFSILNISSKNYMWNNNLRSEKLKKVFQTQYFYFEEVSRKHIKAQTKIQVLKENYLTNHLTFSVS